MEILDDTGFPIMFLDDEWVYEGLVENNSETNRVEPKPGTHKEN